MFRFGCFVCWLTAALGAVGAEPQTRPAYSPNVVKVVEYYRFDLEAGFEAEPGYAHVQGAAVGGGASEGEWHRQAGVMLKNGGRADFELLLAEQGKSLRAMGLYCLVKSDGEKALPILKKHFADKEQIYVLDYGCVGEAMTMGDFAEDLVWNTKYLEYNQFDKSPSLPLIPKAELVRQGLQTLVKDTPAATRHRYDRRMRQLLTADPALLNLEQLRKQNADIAVADIIRVIGCLYDADPIRAFLIQCVDDKELDDTAMVEVVRALSRYHGYPDARMALAQVKESVRKKAETVERVGPPFDLRPRHD